MRESEIMKYRVCNCISFPQWNMDVGVTWRYDAILRVVMKVVSEMGFSSSGQQLAGLE